MFISDMDNSTTVTKKMQASRKLEIISDLVKLMEADGIKEFRVTLDDDARIMTYRARELYNWLKDRDLNPKVVKRATYTTFPGEISAEVNGIMVHTYCTAKELEELEEEHETL